MRALKREACGNFQRLVDVYTRTVTPNVLPAYRPEGEKTPGAAGSLPPKVAPSSAPPSKGGEGETGEKPGGVSY